MRVENELFKAKIVTKVLFESDYTSLKTEDVLRALEGNDRLRVIPRNELLETPVVKLAATHGLVNSAGKFSSSPAPCVPAQSECCGTGAARDLIKSKGLYVNNQNVSSAADVISAESLVDGRMAILRAGAKRRLVLVAEEP